MSSYAFFYYGADAIPSVENTIDTLANGLFNDRCRNRKDHRAAQEH